MFQLNYYTSDRNVADMSSVCQYVFCILGRSMKIFVYDYATEGSDIILSLTDIGICYLEDMEPNTEEMQLLQLNEYDHAEAIRNRNKTNDLLLCYAFSYFSNT